ncbi:HipA family kinase [Mangrovimonas sp. TPBH4]|uniref:HipA family kinase n=1 Tax=Mangrovimonas sp. TPBH4 TaxID=1645914 RepID=UPI0006B580B6|nr:HipA family kinase [Mangrovimonas sp. TPBH4]
MSIAIRHVNVMRYITPLREGGSLPAIAEADDGFNYVVKFRGAGHGVKGLIAEYLGCEIARKLGLLVPEVVFAELDEAFGRTEGDEEIQDLLKWSQGLNIGLHYLSGAVNYDPVVLTPDPLLASKIVWLDAFITNIDRTTRNTNMLIWNKNLWLIDHGASFYFHHSWNDIPKAAKTPFNLIKDHVLLAQASELEQVHQEFKALLTEEVINDIVNNLPDTWLQWEGYPYTEQDLKNGYLEFLNTRLAHSEIFTNQAIHARKDLI